jgi:hypothetical protein
VAAVLSPQLIVAVKSLGGAPVLASVKVALRLLLETPSVLVVALAVPAVRAASFTVAVVPKDVLLPPSSATAMLTV